MRNPSLKGGISLKCNKEGSGVSDEVEVARIERGYGKFIIIKIAKWKESNYIDIREYYTESESKEVKPSKKGIRFSSELLEEVQEAIEKARELIENPVAQ